MRYADGTECRAGDHVDDDGYLSIVDAVIETDGDQAAWGTDRPGLMLRSDAFGLAFHPLDSVDWNAIIFLRRGQESESLS